MSPDPHSSPPRTLFWQSIAQSGILTRLRQIRSSLTHSTPHPEPADETIIASERRFRALIEHASDAIAIASPEGIILYASPEAARIVGSTPEKMVGRSSFANVHPDDLERARATFQRVLETPGESVVSEFRLKHHDGSWRWVEGIGSNLLHDPSVGALVANYRDITERKHAEARLHERQAHSQSLLRLSQQLERAQTYSEALNAALAEVKLTIGYQNLWVYLLSKDKESAHALIAGGDTAQPAVEEFQTLRVRGDRMMQEIAQARHIVVVPDARTDERTDKEIVAALGNRTIVNVPILLFDQHLGAIGTGTFGEEGVRPPSTAECEYLSAMASHMAVTLDRIHLLTERRRIELAEQEERALAQALRDTAAVLNSSLNIDKVLEQILRNVARVVPHDAANVMLIEAGVARIVRSQGYAERGVEQAVRRMRFTISETKHQKQMVETGQPVIIPDAHAYANGRLLPETMWVRSYIGAPIRIHQEVIGFLFLDSATPAFFTNAHAYKLQAFADQAAIAVQNARLFAETARRAAHLTTLNEIGHAISTLQDLEGVLQVMYQQVRQILSLDVFFVGLYDPATDVLTFPIVYDSGVRYTPPPDRLEHQSSTWRVIETGTPLRINRSAEELALPVDPPLSIGDAAKRSASLLFVPLIVGTQTIGVMSAQSYTPHSYRPEHLTLLSGIAHQAATAVQNARLYEQVRHRADEFAGLYETARDLAAQTSVPALLDTIIERATVLLAVPFGSVYLYDRMQNNLELISTRGLKAELGSRMQLGEGMSGHVAVTREPLIVDDYPHWGNRSFQYADAPLMTAISVPMLYGGDLIGVVTLGELVPSARTFTESDQRLLTLFASQAASAVHDAHLLQMTRQRLAELEAVNRISKRLRVARTVEEMLPPLLDETLAALGSDAGAVWLYHESDQKLHQAIASGWLVQLHEPPIESGEGLVGSVFAGDEAQTMQDFAGSPFLCESISEPVLAAQGGVGVPIRTAQQVIGTLFVAVPLPQQVTQPQVHLLTTVAEIAGNAIHRTRLHMETERRLERLSALQAIDASISSILDLPVTLNVLLDQVIHQLRVDAADILLLNAYTQSLTYAAGRGFTTKAIEQSYLRLGEGFAGRAALERQTVVCPNLGETVGAFTRDKMQATERFVSYYGVPLIAKGKVLGVLEIFHRAALAPDPEWLDFLEALAKQAAIAIDNTELFDDLQRTNQELELAYDATINGWSHALDLRDKETEGHTRRVTDMTERLARTLGVSDAEMIHLRRGALLHDIGKMGIPDSILLKPGPLDVEEWQLMRKHPTYAYEMLYPIKYLRPALDIPYCHHEKWDGTGYPRGLRQEQIPLAARIFAVVDVWDALRSDRPYRNAWTENQVREYIRSMSGIHFDPSVVTAFLKQLANEVV